MTHLLAATATDSAGLPWPILAVTVAAAVILYTASCTWWPFARCRCCDGTGRHARNDGKVFRRCRWCRSTGRRLRLGRRAYNALRRRQRDAT